MTEYKLFFISNESFYKEARKAEEEEKVHEPGTDVAEEGIFFLQIRRDKLKLVHTMLHKVTHNYSAPLLEEHLKCSVERSRFTSGGDVIEKKPYHLRIITPSCNEEP